MFRFSSVSITGRLLPALGFGCLVALAATPAHAQVSLGVDDSASVLLGVGDYDFIDSRGADPAVAFRGEYRFSQTFLKLRPFIGAEGTTRSTVYGYAGIGLDIGLGQHVVLTPNFAVGAWARGQGKNLGSPLEFRSGLDLAYRFNDHARLGVTFQHISNAGLARTNPGEEETLVYYSLPLGLIF